jgi:DUF1680 family protein
MKLISRTTFLKPVLFMKTRIYFILFVLIVSSQMKAQQQKTNYQKSELTKRIEMDINRLVYGKEPEITADFILADVTLDPLFKRRFTDFSGDQSGRYLSVFSKIKVEGNPIDIHQLAKKIIATQKSDGRFGSDTLIFEASQLQGEHMALLWGNGRLLTGLMDYYEAFKDPAVLKSAIKLGDFLSSITKSCIKPDIIASFKNKGAMGFICFTQNIEGLVKLYNATNNQKYIQLAEEIYPLLPEMGNQHSHGYLNTLRGVLMLYNVTKQQEQKDFVISRYKEVFESTDYMVTGGVPEFFGGPGSSADGYRDEGCSEADWVMLSLELWKTTAEMKYLNNAEYSLMNELMLNQFESGDFGHHHIEPNFGYKLSAHEARAWWCCDYHGLEAMLQSKDLIITNDNGIKKINLFYNSEFKDDDIAFDLLRTNNTDTIYKIKIKQSGSKSVSIGIRKPYWAKSMTLKINNVSENAKEQAGYLVITRKWKENEEIEIKIEYDLKFITKERKVITLEQAQGNLNGVAMQYGPYLMGIDDGSQPLFLSEPATKNVIIINKSDLGILKTNLNKGLIKNSLVSDGYLTFKYIHDGFYGENNVTMRPVSEISHQRLANLKFWFNFKIN